MKRSYVLTGLVAAVVIALAGNAVAGSGDGEATVAKKKKKAKPGPQGPAGPQGAQGPQGVPGAAGTAKGYGHWFGGTQTQDPNNQKNVQIAAAGPNGEYCINAVGFTPESISVTIDQSGQSLLPNRVADAGLGGYGGCSGILPGTDAFVRTHLTNDDFVSAGFFVVLN